MTLQAKLLYLQMRDCYDKDTKVNEDKIHPLVKVLVLAYK